MIEPSLIQLITTIILIGVVSRLPFRDFPLDDDFGIYTYRARFADKGFKWKKDLQIIGLPIWKMLLMDRCFGIGRASSGNSGYRRIRHLQTLFHVMASLAVFYCIYSLTGNAWAAFAGGSLHAFYGTSPDLTAGSFNFEQFYIPFTLLGLTFLIQGPEKVLLAGLCFGLATIPKYSTGLYTLTLMVPVGVVYGMSSALGFAIASSIPFIISNIIDFKLGFWDSEARKQMRTRMATTLRLTRTKAMYFSRVREVKTIFLHTLPLWIAGLAGIITSFALEQGIILGTFALTTLAMIYFQRGFSRYHYLPWITFLSIPAGLGFYWAMHSTGFLGMVVLIATAMALLWNSILLAAFYFRPTAPSTLSRYEKFDQYLYLPALGKQLKRLIKMRQENNERIFVWGTFSQLYHITGLPSSDNYLHYSIGPWNTQDLEGYFDTVIGGLIRHKPRYLIKSYADLDIDLLREITGLDYRLIKIAMARFPVYRLAKSRRIAPNPITLSWQEKMALMEKLTDSDWHAPGVIRDDLLNGRTLQALKECRKMLRLNPEDFNGQKYLGEIYDHMNQHEQSATAFQSAIHLQPGIPYTRLMLAKQKILLGKFEEAKALIREETKRFGKNPEMIFLLGLLHHRLGEHQEAVIFLEKFRTQFPERHDCWEFLIDSYSEIQDVDNLQRCYHSTEKISLQKDRNWLQTRIVLAISKTQENSQGELATLDYYLQLTPKNFHLLYSKASALEKMGNILKARQLFRIVAESEPSNSIRAGAWFRLARLAEGQEQKLMARKCLDIDPDHSGARTLIIKQVSTLRPLQKSLSDSISD